MTYSSRVTRKPITVAETPVFVRQAAAVWDDAEREAFVDFIARDPEAGDVIPDTGGVRKVRWGRQGSGKRGGARVIYFFGGVETTLYLLLVYAKARQADLTAEQRNQVRELVGFLKRRRPHRTKEH